MTITVHPENTIQAMRRKIRLTIAQLNLTVGAIDANTDQIIAALQQARGETDIILFPELSISAYPPEDLLFRPAFYAAIQAALARIVTETGEFYALIGHPHREGRRLYNAASLIRKQKIIHTYYKQNLPNYGVFDEKRYFSAGNEPCLFEINGCRAALSICEDLWAGEPVRQAAAAGASILFNINASPYDKNQLALREQMIAKRAKEANLHIVYANLVGGQDELVFDGNSMIVDNRGEPVFHAPAFEAGLFTVNLDMAHKPPPPANAGLAQEQEQIIYAALLTGVRDYIGKNRFSGAVIGLSGGIDSALTLCIAADALGPENVEAVIMPSRFTAAMSIEDAEWQAQALNVRHETISIQAAFDTFLASLGPRFAGLPADITEENIQARCRGLILMAISNKTGRLVLTTGNKSEMAVGYATLYGDMAGGFAPLKDIWKTMVYRLAKWRNRRQTVIPERVLTRPPSAELRPDQVDQDSLPDYAVLDPILELYIEDDTPPEAIIARGFAAETVRQVLRLVDKSEYKRRQAAPGVRITARAFGRDRRYPVTSGYVEGKSG